MGRRNKLILEFTEFNVQRFNSDSVRPAMHVDNPQLSTNAFDKHQDGLRQAMARIDSILFKLKGTSAYSSLRSKLAIEDQDIQSMKVLRIVRSNSVHYDVFITFVISEEEYWGKVENILGVNPTLSSEVFKDYDLYQPKEWVIKIKGLVIKTIKEWLKPQPGEYKLLKDEIICYSSESGKQIRIKEGTEITLVRSHDDKIIIKYQSDYFNLVDDNYVYFNWWFEKVG